MTKLHRATWRRATAPHACRAAHIQLVAQSYSAIRGHCILQVVRMVAEKRMAARKNGVSTTIAGAPRKYASSVDVARLAGVSQSAVSRTFTEGASVSAKTRQKVIDAAAALGYQPSVIPKILLTQKSSLIAVVIGGM